MPVSTPKYKNLFCQTLKKQVLIRGFLLYFCLFIGIVILIGFYVPHRVQGQCFSGAC